MTNAAPWDTFGATPFAEGLLGAADLALLSIESWPQAVVFIEAESLKVFWMNTAGSQSLRSQSATLSGGRISLAQRGRQGDFEQFLRGAETEPSSWILDLADDRGALVFRCRSLVGTGYKLVTIFNPDTPSTSLPDVGRLLGLTRSESRITQGLMDGRRADELAQEQGVSLETVRTHIRRIYLKTGTNSREQLIAKISAFRVP